MADSEREPLDGFLREARVAYFSMEVALRSEIPTYAGGLGVLAGDTLRSAADLEVPMVGVSLVSRQGYFRQVIDGAGRQRDEPSPWDPAEHPRPLGAMVALEIGAARVWVSRLALRARGPHERASTHHPARYRSGGKQP